MRWYGRRGENVMRWQFGNNERVVSREGGMEFNEKNCVVLLQGSKMYAGIHCRDLIIFI